MSAEKLAISESYFISGAGDPVELRPISGDVIFPRLWTLEMAASWREKNLSPGAEWPRPDVPGQ